MVTFTTVGYGDLTPVTLLGHTFCLVSSGRKNGIILQIMEQNLILWLKISMFTPEILEKTYKEYCETKKSEAIQDMYPRLDHARWLRFYTFYNWSYGIVRDDTAWELLGNLSIEMN